MLSQLVSRIAHKIRRVTRNPTTRYSRFFNNDKKWLIDFTLQRLTPQVRTFADIGGIWNVDGAYTFYALDEYPIEAAYIVDTDFTERVVEKSVKYPQLTCVAGNFGEPSIIDKVGSVDAIFLFDVLF